MITKTIQVMGGVCILAIALVVVVSPTFAAPDAGAALNPVKDTWISFGDSTPHDGEFLQLTEALFPGPATIGVLQFDLTGAAVPGLITKVRLNMPPTCVVDPISIAVYSASDNWTEATATFSNITRGTTPLITVVLDGNANNYQYFEDLTNGALAQYLTAEKNGDGIATLWLEPTGTNGDAAWFVDRIGNDAGCPPPSPGTIVLQVADETGPLAISLSSFAATSNNPAIWLWAAGILIMITLIIFLILQRLSQVMANSSKVNK